MENNIAEQIIEMYRKEDLMRIYKFDLEKFGTQVINFFPISPKEKLAQVNHYEEFIKKMQTEGIETSGHLKEVNQLTNTLNTLHIALKKSDENYYFVYKKAALYIQENLDASHGAINDEIQICLNGIYGYFLMKIEGRPIQLAEQKMVDTFGDLLSLLSYKYNENQGKFIQK